MKVRILTLIAILLSVAVVYAAGNKIIKTTIHSTTTIPAGFTVYSPPINLVDMSPTGNFSFYHEVTTNVGSNPGAVAITYMDCNVEPCAEPAAFYHAGTLVTASTKTGGKTLTSFSPTMTPYMMIKFVESGSGSVINSILNVQ